mmetsp:Transcript_42396/g.112204  ORF Transcript_42396/g.112204 Transcript_42396/m.112204 type:complete len:401 (-) Transcript_42396:184-1386(-)
MGSFLSQPVTDKESSSGSGATHAWGCTSMQGWRNNMEDSHITISDLGGDQSGVSFFGVFDGHGGKEVALFCRDRVPDVLREQLGRHCGSAPKASPLGESLGGSALRDTFHAVDDLLRAPEQAGVLLALKQGRPAQGSDSEEDGKLVQGAGRKGQVLSHLHNSIQSDLAQARGKGALTKEEAKQVIMKMALLKRMAHTEAPTADSSGSSGTAADHVGCTAVCILLTPTEVVCANAGDSRAVLCRKGRPVELSHDHKPDEDTEKSRIEAAGGRVEENHVGDRVICRVNGNLSLSRAIGDLEFKRRADLGPEAQMICATPDIIAEPLTDEDEFIVLACDGVWDVKTNQEVIDYVRPRLRQGQRIPDVIEGLLDACLCESPQESHGLGADNMTCIIVQLEHGSS